MKVVGVIPARYASTRFPGKPLVDILGKSMIERVYLQAKKSNSLDDVIVATDDLRIFKLVKGFGGRVMMTGDNHPNGTSRCNEVISALEMNNENYDVVVNIQGDEPYIEPGHISELVRLFNDDKTEISSLSTLISDNKELFNSNVVKVVMDHGGKALYFSRQAVPFVMETQQEEWLKKTSFYKHIGIYAYQTSILKSIANLPSMPLEQSERLEQLRWLEHGFSINIKIIDYKGVGIDTPEDLKNLLTILANKG